MAPERTSLVSVPNGELDIFLNTARWLRTVTIYRKKSFGFLVRTDEGALWIGPGVDVEYAHDVIDPALPPMLSADETSEVEAWLQSEGPTGYPVVVEIDDSTVELTCE